MDEEHRGCGDGLRSLLIRLVVLLLRLEAKRGAEGGPRPPRARPAWRSCLQLTHAVGEHPERAIEPHVLIDTLMPASASGMHMISLADSVECPRVRILATRRCSSARIPMN